MLGICRKAGKLEIGFARSAESLKTKRSFGIYVASDLSAKTEKELSYIAAKSNIPVVRTCYDSAALSQAVGIKTGVLSVNDEGFANSLKEKYKGESQI